jgi:hypothetical protein
MLHMVPEGRKIKGEISLAITFDQDPKTREQEDGERDEAERV